MDNSQYKLGFDLYEGNTVKSWAALAGVARFVYLRTSLGLYKDKGFVSFAKAAKGAGLLVGAFHETWPNVGISAQVRTMQSQIAAAGVVMDLPPAIAYEEQQVEQLNSKGKGTGKFVWTWANPADLTVYRDHDLPGCVIYLNEAGLKILKSAHIDFSSWPLWFADYFLHQGTDGEMGVSAILQNLVNNYGVDPGRVIFCQTADAIPYPVAAISPDKGADYNRAVNFVFPTDPGQPPTPAPAPGGPDWAPTIAALQATDATQQAQINDIAAQLTVIDSRLIALESRGTPAQPGPGPEPVPAVTNIWTLKTRDELTPPMAHDGSFDAIAGHGQSNALLLQKPELDFIYSLAGTFFGYACDNARLRHWSCNQKMGNLYIQPDKLPDFTEVWDPVILCGSTNFMRQRVHVLEFSDDGAHLIGRPGRVARLEGIAFEQYAGESPILTPWKFMFMFTDFRGGGWGPSHPFPDGTDATFIKPLFDPGTFPDDRKKKGTYDFWISVDFLKEQIA